jgi:hypothetical protein
MINAPLNRPHLSRLAYALIPILLAACSGGSGGDGDSSFTDAQRTYEESTARRTAEVAGTLTAASVEQLASGASVNESFAKQFQGEISNFTIFLCDQIKALGNRAGSGDTKTKRLDNVRVASEELVRDGFARALLEKVLALPAEQRETLLDALGLKATSTDSAELPGTQALKNAGLLDAQGQIAIPQRGTDQYTRYERWLQEEAPGLAGTISILSGNARAEIDRCASSA